MEINRKTDRVVLAAIELWRTNRPLTWGIKQHLENPEINTQTDAERALARAVAAYLKERK